MNHRSIWGKLIFGLECWKTSSVFRSFSPRLFPQKFIKVKNLTMLSPKCHRAGRSYRQGDKMHQIWSRKSHNRQYDEKGSGLYPIGKSPFEECCIWETIRYHPYFSTFYCNLFFFLNPYTKSWVIKFCFASCFCWSTCTCKLGRLQNCISSGCVSRYKTQPPSSKHIPSKNWYIIELRKIVSSPDLFGDWCCLAHA